ncbi:MAG: hypothetical protein RL454_862 [Actinomycetota bacterium]
MAYGARLESALGESPRGFESPILRKARARRQTMPARWPQPRQAKKDSDFESCRVFTMRQ